jgi:exodeoxyribonuclease-3
MTKLKIASWNINSVRARADLVGRLLDEEQPDILCLQETKALDSVFPAALFHSRGYVHHELNGQKMHHGVAILSRLPLHDSGRHDWQDNGEARHVGARLDCGVRLENVYIPAGGDIPDRAQNPKFGQKLDFLERMARWAEAVERPTLIAGDFNVAPLDCDVYDHKALLKVVSHTPIECQALARFKEAHGWVDIGREHIPAPERNYSWWSYRAFWRQKDQGRRLDHMWASPDLARQARTHRVVEETRRWEQPSDHVPLVTEFDL